MKYIRKILPILIPLLLSNLYAFDVSITSKALEGHLRYEENRNYGYWFDIAAIGEVKLSFTPPAQSGDTTFTPPAQSRGGRGGEPHLTFRSGFLYGDMEYSNELKMFTSAKWTGLPRLKARNDGKRLPIDLTLYWIYNGLPDLEVYENSLLPTITYNWSKRSFTLGYNTRWTTFFKKETITEHSLVYAYRSDFIKKEKLQMSFVLGNYSEFKVNAVTGLTYHLIANIPLPVQTSNDLSLQCGIELLQSGFLNFVEDVYGLSMKMGVRYKF